MIWFWLGLGAWFVIGIADVICYGIARVVPPLRLWHFIPGTGFWFLWMYGRQRP